MIDVNIYELSKLDEKILENACMMIDNHWSLRTLSKNVLKSKSQLHRDFKKLKNFISLKTTQMQNSKDGMLYMSFLSIIILYVI